MSHLGLGFLPDARSTSPASIGAGSTTAGICGTAPKLLAILAVAAPHHGVSAFRADGSGGSRSRQREGLDARSVPT